jgi:phospholipid/cholesterol/gamma-HCH transport system substrate-binding protein
MMDGVNKGEGSIGLLMKDDSLYYNVNETVATLQFILNEIKANPKKIKLSVF